MAEVVGSISIISLTVMAIGEKAMKKSPNSVEEKKDERQSNKNWVMGFIALAILLGFSAVIFRDFVMGWEGMVYEKYIHEKKVWDAEGVMTIEEHFIIKIDPGGKKELVRSTWDRIEIGDYIIKKRWSFDYTYGSSEIRVAEQAGFHEKALDIIPTYAGGWHRQGVILMKKGYYEDAIYRFDKTIEMDASYGIAWYNKGLALIGLGRYEDAKECFTRAEKLYYSTTWRERNELDHDNYEWLGREKDEGVTAPCKKCHEN